MIGPSLEMLHM